MHWLIDKTQEHNLPIVFQESVLRTSALGSDILAYWCIFTDFFLFLIEKCCSHLIKIRLSVLEQQQRWPGAWESLACVSSSTRLDVSWAMPRIGPVKQNERKRYGSAVGWMHQLITAVHLDGCINWLLTDWLVYWSIAWMNVHCCCFCNYLLRLVCCFFFFFSVLVPSSISKPIFCEENSYQNLTAYF